MITFEAYISSFDNNTILECGVGPNSNLPIRLVV